jgi:hypothetical protein
MLEFFASTCASLDIASLFIYSPYVKAEKRVIKSVINIIFAVIFAYEVLLVKEFSYFMVYEANNIPSKRFIVL